MAEDMFTLQQEALRRAREMHSRAAPLPNQAVHSNTPPQQNRPNNEHHTAEKHEEHPTPPPPPTQHEGSQDILGALFKDKDKTIILALLILLSGENGDNSLLFALMYLLM